MRGMNIKIAFAGTRHGQPGDIVVVQHMLELATRFVAEHEKLQIHPQFGLSAFGSSTEIVVAHGASPVGTCLDWDAERVARQQRWAVKRYPVEHELDGAWPAAGPRRTRRMLQDFCPNILVAMPLAFGKSKGTEAAIKIARELFIPVIVWPIPR